MNYKNERNSKMSNRKLALVFKTVIWRKSQRIKCYPGLLTFRTSCTLVVLRLVQGSTKMRGTVMVKIMG